MTKADFEKLAMEAQQRICEYNIAEAKARKEKAEVELETARIQQEYVLRMLSDSSSKNFVS